VTEVAEPVQEQGWDENHPTAVDLPYVPCPDCQRTLRVVSVCFEAGRYEFLVWCPYENTYFEYVMLP
jgi:hypothetical protein